jgi:hypothetical protein
MKRLLIVFVTFLGLVLISACSTTSNTKLNPNYQAYLNTVSKYHPKLVEIEAQPGQTIEMKGVAKFVVYAPSNSAMRIQAYRPAPNPGVQITHEVLSTVFGTAKDILPGYFGWRYGSSILKKAFDSAGTHVQGNYNTGTYTTVGADLVQGDKTMGNKYTAQGDITGGDKNTVTGDYVTGTKTDNNIQGDYVTGTKTDVTGDYVTGTKTDYTDSYNKTNGNLDNSSLTE